MVKSLGRRGIFSRNPKIPYVDFYVDCNTSANGLLSMEQIRYMGTMHEKNIRLQKNYLVILVCLYAFPPSWCIGSIEGSVCVDGRRKIRLSEETFGGKLASCVSSTIGWGVGIHLNGNLCGTTLQTE